MIFTDILNYLRYYPETFLTYQKKLESDIKARDEETEAISKKTEEAK